MPEHAAKIHVPLGDLQIGRANASLANFDQRVAIGDDRFGAVGVEGEGLVEEKGAHKSGFGCRVSGSG